MWFSRRSEGRRRRPAIPDGMRVYAIGDVHGCTDLLDQVLSFVAADIAANPTSRPLQIFLGDYVDRGPASAQVLDRLIKHSSAAECIFLKGNHEVCLRDFLRNPSVLAEWRQVGGLETLASYGLKPTFSANVSDQAELAAKFGEVLPENHRRFLDELKPSFSCGDFFFVHAGVKPGIPLPQQQDKDLLWIRDDFLKSNIDFGKVIVHGHSPVLEPEVRPNRINIDTGSYASGRLTCLTIQGDALRLTVVSRQTSLGEGVSRRLI